MGKISKALEKAEKENISKPVRRPIPDRVRPDRDAAIPPAGNQPAARSEQPRVPDRVRYEPVAPLHQHPTSDVDPSTPEPIEPRVENRLMHPSEKRPEPGNGHQKVGPAGVSVESTPELAPDAGSKTDGVGISLVKPDVQPPPRVVEPVAREPEHEQPRPESAVSGKPGPAKNVQVRYSKTKVQVNDPERLRNNRIVSFFDDLESTDQIKMLRTQVLRKLKAIGGNSILVTSANPYEGKTFTSINLGVSIAKEFDRTVLIIDADIRRPTQRHTAFATEFFSLDVEKGLTDFLEGEADISDILINPGIDRLTLIPGGVPVDNAPELLNSARMEEMMLEIKNRYPSDRVVILDGPAILPFPDAVILSRYVDGVLPVIESERTSGEDLKKMMSHLKDVNILGTVLNKNRG